MSVSNISLGVNRFKHLFSQLFGGYLSIVLFSILVWLVSFIALFFLLNNGHDTHIFKKSIEARIILNIDVVKDKTVDYYLPSGKFVSANSIEFINHKTVKNSVNKTLKTIKIDLYLSTLISAVFLGLFIHLFIQYGKRLGKGKHIRGGINESKETINKQLENDTNLGQYQIAGLYLPKNSELTHMFISGGSGCGKSNLIKEYLDQIRANDQKFIIFDASGEFVRKYYRENYDIILNPFDTRMPEYSIWKECETDQDYDNTATSFLPSPASETHSIGTASDHFNKSGRTLMADTMRRLHETDKAVPENLLKFINHIDLEMLLAFLSGTDSQGVIRSDNPKHASDVRSTLTPAIKSIRYLQGDIKKSGFSLRQWTRSDYDKRCVFISCKRRYRVTLAPLISAWFDIFCNELMSLDENPERRVNLIIDELASLPKIESIIDFTNEARKYGGCGLFSVTSFEELNNKYGTSRAKTFVSMCGTKVSYRYDEPDTAQWVSKLYLEEELKDIRQGVSQQAQRADAVSTTENKDKKYLFSPSEIMLLKNNTCLVKIPGGYPVTKLDIEPRDREDIAAPFINQEIKIKPIIVKKPAKEGEGEKNPDKIETDQKTENERKEPLL